MKIIAITQARYGSKRFPAKVLRKVGDQSLLEVHIKRILQAKLITKLKVATTTEDGAEEIVKIANLNNVEAYKGSIDNVLERFYKCVKDDKPDYVVRLTSDCPLIDPVIIDDVIKICTSGNFDYVSNTLIPTFPDGTDVEVFKFSALERAYKEATLKSDKEHVTPYIWRNSSVNGGNLFNSFNYSNVKDFSNYRITVDTSEDFEVIRLLINALGVNKSWEDYIEYLDKNPQIKEINSSNSRNEGYAKSLLND